jgi:hypothetical protein
MSAETLRKWPRRAAVDEGQAPACSWLRKVSLGCCLDFVFIYEFFLTSLEYFKPVCGLNVTISNELHT